MPWEKGKHVARTLLQGMPEDPQPVPPKIFSKVACTCWIHAGTILIVLWGLLATRKHEQAYPRSLGHT